jgi:hypothetical protein
MKLTYLKFAAFLMLVSCGSNGGDFDLIPVKSGEKYLYINLDGEIVINPQFSEAFLFRDGLALVKSTGDEPKYGYITEEGQFAINANYMQATEFSEGIAWVVNKNEAPTAINEKGEILFTLTDAENVNTYSEGLAGFSTLVDDSFKWGFVDRTGKIVISPQFKSVLYFQNGTCAAMNDEGDWGFIDEEGKIIINYQFDSAMPFLNGKAVVESGDSKGVIDEDGKYIINPQFEEIFPDGDLFMIESNGNTGWTDDDGKIIINPQFDDALPFGSSDLAPFKTGKRWGYIDREGKIAINPQFNTAMPFMGDLALVQSGKKTGVINKEGRYEVNPQFGNLPDVVKISMVLANLNLKVGQNSAETDYFNVSAILSGFNIENPDGLTLENATISDLGIPSEDIAKWRNYQNIYDDKTITNEASLRFRVYHDKAVRSVQDGWYTKSVYNPNAALRAFEYYISLSGRGYRKAEDVADAVLDNYKNFTVNEKESKKSKKVLESGNQKLTVDHGSSWVKITYQLVD